MALALRGLGEETGAEIEEAGADEVSGGAGAGGVKGTDGAGVEELEADEALSALRRAFAREALVPRRDHPWPLNGRRLERGGGRGFGRLRSGREAADGERRSRRADGSRSSMQVGAGDIQPVPVAIVMRADCINELSTDRRRETLKVND